MLGGWVDPYDVLSGGAQYSHAIWSGVRWSAEEGNGTTGLYIESLDAAMACPLIAQWNISSHKQQTYPQTLMGDGSTNPCDTDGLNGPGGQQQLNRTGGCPTAHACRSYGIGGMALQLHSNRMGISGFAQWYPFGIKSLKKGSYQKADENILYRFRIKEVL